MPEYISQWNASKFKCVCVNICAYVNMYVNTGKKELYWGGTHWLYLGVFENHCYSKGLIVYTLTNIELSASVRIFIRKYRQRPWIRIILKTHVFLEGWVYKALLIKYAKFSLQN